MRTPEQVVGQALLETGEFRFNAPIDMVDLRFTLTYEGPLPSYAKKDGRSEEKHAIRKQLHLQLRDLWESKHHLKQYLRTYEHEAANPQVKEAMKGVPHFIHEMRVGDFTFIPLVTEVEAMVCELDILFLRREKRGRLFSHHSAGDLDNRLKILLDALRAPANGNELPPAEKPDEGESPFFCLLEDDRLITAIRIESEQLLFRGSPQLPESTVKLVIRASVKLEALTFASTGRAR
jgi:hypothetical protein